MTESRGRGRHVTASASCVFEAAPCVSAANMTSGVLSCTRAPLVSPHCSLSPDVVCGVMGPSEPTRQLSVLTGCRLVHQLHVCLWQWSSQSLVHVPKWSEAELALPRSSPVSAMQLSSQ